MRARRIHSIMERILLLLVVGSFHAFPGEGLLGHAWEYQRLFSNCPSGSKNKIFPGDSKIMSLTPFTLQFHMPSEAVTFCELAEMSILVDDYIEASLVEQLQLNDTESQGMTLKTNLVSHVHGETWGTLTLEFETVLAFFDEHIYDLHRYDTLLNNSFNVALDDFMALIYNLPKGNFFRDTDRVEFAFAPTDARTSARISQSSTTVISHPFHIFYRLPEGKSPSAMDILALEKLTNRYLQSFVMHDLRLSKAFILAFSTGIISHSLSDGWIDATFEFNLDLASNSPMVIPSARDLDQARKRALSEDNLIDYTEMLDGLPKTNVFSYTIFVRSDRNLDLIEETTSLKSYSVGSSFVFIFIMIGAVTTLVRGFSSQHPTLCCGHREATEEVIQIRTRRVLRQRENRAAKVWEVPSKIDEKQLDDTDQTTIYSDDGDSFGVWPQRD